MALLPESPEDDADDIDQHLLEEDLELHLGEAGRNWERPAPPPLDPSMQSLGELLSPSPCNSSLLSPVQPCASLMQTYGLPLTLTVQCVGPQTHIVMAMRLPLQLSSNWRWTIT